MKLSVVMPAYNAAETIDTQLEALCRQTWDGPWEVIVADNGSSDATRNVAERFRERLPGFRVVDASDCRGAGHARNMGAKAAGGEVLLFCDADDEVSSGWLQAMGLALQQHDFVASRLEGEKLSSPRAVGARMCPQRDGLQPYRHPPYLPHAASAGLGIKRSVHESVGGFDESFYKLQDTDYCWRVQLAGHELHFVPDALVHMRFREDTRTICRQAREWGEYNVRLYKKYRPLGMPKASWRKGVGKWRRLLARVSELREPRRRVKWLWDLNWAFGRLRGCLKYRVLAP